MIYLNTADSTTNAVPTDGHAYYYVVDEADWEDGPAIRPARGRLGWHPRKLTRWNACPLPLSFLARPLARRLAPEARRPRPLPRRKPSRAIRPRMAPRRVTP